MISVVIVTLNEEKKLAGCLDSIKDEADEIVIVDLGSEDKILQIAAKFKAKIYHHQRVDFVESVRDFSISKANGDWILILDPDERMQSNLWSKLQQISKQGKYVSVNIPRKNIFFNHWIAHTNWWPDRHIRFFKKGKVKWDNKIHSYPLVDGEILNLGSDENLAILHYGYDCLTQFIERQNRYSNIESRNLYNLGMRFSWKMFFWKPLREFLARFIKHAGFLDGFYGFALTILMMIYQMEVMIKLWELEKQNK